MARKKRDGRRALGVQSKKGRIYIVTSQRVLKDGEWVVAKKWTTTGLADTPENVQKAVDMRKAMLSSKGSALSTDRDVSLEVYLDLYLSQKKRTVSDTTFSGYRNRGLRLKKYFGAEKLRTITRSDVEQFLDSLITEHGNQERTIRDTKSLFKSLMECAVKDGLIADNPVKEASVSKALLLANAKEKNDQDFFSYEEALDFLKIVEHHELYELFYVVLFFGLRREEVLGLRWSCIDFRNKTFQINHTVTIGTAVNRVNSTKTDSSTRTYPLTEEQIGLFKRMKSAEENYRELFGQNYNENEYIFKHQDGALYYPDYPSKAFSKVIRTHPELPQGITFHGLRKSCVSILVHQGYDIKTIQKWVGHADVDTTLKIYARVKDKESKQEVLKGMDQIIQIKKYDD